MEERKTLLKRIAAAPQSRHSMRPICRSIEFLFDTILVNDHNDLKLLYEI
jgi:hypothetical protein